MGEEERSILNLSLPKKAIDFFKSEWGIERLHPPQFEAMEPLSDEQDL